MNKAKISNKITLAAKSGLLLLATTLATSSLARMPDNEYVCHVAAPGEEGLVIIQADNIEQATKAADRTKMMKMTPQHQPGQTTSVIECIDRKGGTFTKGGDKLQLPPL
ncbi:MAG: hypothetical protein V7746_21145 [Halioglobus sp.]